MDTNELREKWPVLKKKLAQEYPESKAEELMCEIGREEELLLELQARLGKNKKEIFYVLSLMG